MDNWFGLYMLTRIDDLKGLIGLICVFGVILTCVLATIAAMMRGDPYPKVSEVEWGRKVHKSFVPKMIAATAVMATIYVTIPSKNDVLFIIGGSALLDIAKTDRAKSIGDKTLKAVEQWIDSNLPKDVK